jgi:twitching motility protein PilJ
MPAESDKEPTGFGEPSRFAQPSAMATSFQESVYAAPAAPAPDMLTLPVLGHRLVRQHQETMWVLLWLAVALLVGFTALEAWQSRQLWLLAVVVASVVVLALSVLGLARLQSGVSALLADRSQRNQAYLEQQNREAEAQRLEARRINDANQAAILRLMNELQTVAEGDLTQQATVTEDITGAIADSVNYTVEELRQLVDNVQKTAGRVEVTTTAVNDNSTELLAASGEQLREIRSTGDAVLGMATRINDVSARAQESAEVARQSRRAAESGLQAVQDTIGGMNSIRDQIQETAKRIKRLGESSQEIGEITDLISDITEETNVLALNAAIQAAAAGEAGRGFSVVAEEVQRLAERSGDATRQIAALVKAIQADTQDAVAAMERSTQGVVAGAKLSDSAGSALSEIDQVSRRLTDLIEDISAVAASEAKAANLMAGNIQQIFAVSEQTSEGTRETVRRVRELLRMAEELKQSVSRFKIA